MAELRAPEQNRLLGQLANMLRTTEGDIAAPEFLPRGLDVMGLVRQLMLPSAETVEKLSYGDPLFRMPTQSNIPITADREYLAEVLGMAPAVPAASRATTRLSNEAADQLVRAITRNPEATAPQVLEAAGQMLPLSRIKPTASSARAKVSQSELIGPFYHASPKPDIDEFRATTKQERKETESGDPRGVFFTQDPEYASGYGRYLYETYIPRKAITWNTSGTDFFDESTEAIVPQEFADMVQINRVIDLRDQDLPARPEWWYKSYMGGLLDQPAQSVVEVPKFEMPSFAALRPETEGDIDQIYDFVEQQAKKAGYRVKSGASNISGSRYLTITEDLPDDDIRDIELRISDHGDRHPFSDATEGKISIDPSRGGTDLEAALYELQEKGFNLLR
jgi:hypothetical protein